jgi:hypothetical protein
MGPLKRSDHFRYSPSWVRFRVYDLADEFEQQIVVERLIEKRDGSGSYRKRSRLSVSGDENDRDVALVFAQFGLQLETAHARHFDVGDQATDLVEPVRVQKLLGRDDAYVFTFG